MRKIAILVLIALLSTVAFIGADAKQASDNLLAVANKFAAYITEKTGLKVFAPNKDAGATFDLAKGQAAEINRTFFAGNTYFIIAAGDNAVKSIEISVFDENKNLIDSYSKSQPVGIVRVSPKWTGAFIINIKLLDASGSPVTCGYFTVYVKEVI